MLHDRAAVDDGRSSTVWGPAKITLAAVGSRVLVVLLFLMAFWVSNSARHSQYQLPAFAAPCVAGWWSPGNVAIDIADGSTRAACLSVPEGAIVGRQGQRWAELDVTRFGAKLDCVLGLPSPRVRIEPWQSARALQSFPGNTAWASDFPDYLRFPSGNGATGMEMFVPHDSSSGFRTISCPIGADKCWAIARAGSLLAKWQTERKRLASGLDRDWACVRDALRAVTID